MKPISSKLGFVTPASAVGTAAENRRRLSLLVLLGMLYAVVRVLLIPADGAATKGFTHDGGYITIVAERVRDGAGFTVPAHWLLFLNPPSLPLPFHNANPGYPTLIAALSAVLGEDVIYVGLLVSALSNLWLALAVLVLVQHFSAELRFSALCAMAVALFPPLWRISFVLAPDALCVALVVSALAAAARARSSRGWLVCGVLFGLAWLVRSTSLLILPGLLWWMWRTRTRREAMSAVVVLVVGALLIASPWLVHTQQTWGSPLRSDAGYYWLQDYYARIFEGDVTKFWRSLAPPPSLSQILSSDAKGLLLHTLGGAPILLYLLGAGLSEWSRPAALVLFTLLALATAYSLRRWRSPAFQTGFLIVAATATSLLVAARSFELRYFSGATVLLVLWVLLPLRDFFAPTDNADHAPRRRLRRALAAGCVLYALVFLLAQDRRIFRELTEVSSVLSAYRAVAQEVARAFPDERAIITEQPYLYTYYTKRPALSPPNVEKPELLQFMSKYSARLLLLPTAALEYFYPGFRETLSPEIRVVRQIGTYTLLERTVSP
jgi:hypothetical protein